MPCKEAVEASTDILLLLNNLGLISGILPPQVIENCHNIAQAAMAPAIEAGFKQGVKLGRDLPPIDAETLWTASAARKAMGERADLDCKGDIYRGTKEPTP